MSGWAGGGNHSVDDVSFRYSDGPALLLHGNYSTVSNSEFEWNDWTSVGGVRPVDSLTTKKADDAKTIRCTGDGLTLRRLSFSNNGAAQSANAMGHDPAYPAPLVELCHFQSQLAMQDDGSFIEGGGSVSTEYRRNWCTNTGKAGLRWDNYYPHTGRLRGGVMAENVVWNASGVIVKGDNHNVSYNTIFDGADIPDTNPFHDRPRYQDASSFLGNASIASILIGAGTKEFTPLADANTVVERNLVDSVQISVPNGGFPNTLSAALEPSLVAARKKPQRRPACDPWATARGGVAEPCPPPGTYSGNLALQNESFDIRRELRDPFHLDFRPCPRSRAAAMGVGAYRLQAAGGETSYWIPGRQLRTKVSTPIPPDGAVEVKLDADLMFLPMRGAVAHRVYLGRDLASLTLVGTLFGDANVVNTAGRLAGGTAHVWRVDAVSATDTLVTGAVWAFRTGHDTSCGP